MCEKQLLVACSAAADNAQLVFPVLSLFLKHAMAVESIG
jgi:hypothetical protein